MSNAFDEDALMERVEGDVEFLDETIAMLDEDSPALLAEIYAAVGSGDAASLIKPAHALKGMLSNFCAAPAETAARELETMGREGASGRPAGWPAGVDAAADRVRSETERLRKHRHEFLRSKTK